MILNEEIENKEFKYNTLLRETEIKETHLKSLESMLKRRSEDLNEKPTLFYESQNQEENNSNEKLKETGEFNINPSKEEELNEIIEINKNTNKKTDKINENIYKKEDDFLLFNYKKDEIQSYSGQSFYENKNFRVPGRIYSSKHK